VGEKRSPDGARYYSLGIEFAAAIVGLTLLGYWIDRRFESAPWGVLIGLGFGMVGGTYNLYRAARQWSRAAQSGEAEQIDGSKSIETKKETLDGDEVS
jgi:ATP synthase protein I